MQEQFIQIGDRRLNTVRSTQDAPPLVMLHGVTRCWQTFLPMWSSLSQRWQLSAIDFRGHGSSDKVNGEYGVCDYAADVIAYLDSQFDRPVVLYGHSLGAMVAADVAGKASDRISAVILEDPPLHTMGVRIEQTALLSFFQTLLRLAGDSRDASTIARELGDAIIHDPVRGTQVRLGELRDAASLRFTASCLKRLDPSVLEPVVHGKWLEGFSIEAVFRRVQCPSLLIQADPTAGGMLTNEDADSLEALLVDPVRVKFSGCGHLVHWTKTTELLNCVHGFLESIRVGQTSDRQPLREKRLS
ncbi:MAG: alpha/beta hydrolase [Pirellulaceae bacterium]|nr:alpha/beta hydrolase [Pirellulaceae bacterium]